MAAAVAVQPTSVAVQPTPAAPPVAAARAGITE